MARTAVKGMAEMVLNVQDLKQTQRFYQDVLGFPLHSQFPPLRPTIVFLTVAELDSPLGRGGHPQLLALIDARRHVHTKDSYQGLDQQRSTLNHLAFEIEESDFAPEKHRLEALGLEVSCMDFPHMQAKGMFFHDPEGNLIELICHSSR